jgi:hypothetical protein
MRAAFPNANLKPLDSDADTREGPSPAARR